MAISIKIGGVFRPKFRHNQLNGAFSHSIALRFPNGRALGSEDQTLVVGGLVESNPGFVDTSLDRCLLVALADQVRNAGTLDEVLESLNGVWVDNSRWNPRGALCQTGDIDLNIHRSTHT